MMRARSRKTKPFLGFSTAVSEKADKQAAHRKERGNVRRHLPLGPDPDLLPHKNEISDPHMMAKDGKRVVRGRASKKDLGK